MMPEVPDAVILCGGAGLRLRNVTGDGPKSMASIAGRPFLELPLRQLRRHGFTRVILAVGYQKELIHDHFGERAFDLSLEYSEEHSPLGTGGALRNAAEFVRSDAALIMNGDSYTDVDLQLFVAEHNKTRADASVVVVPTDGRDDCGFVSVGPTDDILRFKEKQALTGSRYLNAGIYLVSRRLICDIKPETRLSLEEELFPQWIANGKSIKAFEFAGKCIDIGTPSRYQDAQDILSNVEGEGTRPRSRSQSS